MTSSYVVGVNKGALGGGVTRWWGWFVNGGESSIEESHRRFIVSTKKLLIEESVVSRFLNRIPWGCMSRCQGDWERLLGGACSQDSPFSIDLFSCFSRSEF